jgi:hypothetical protein
MFEMGEAMDRPMGETRPAGTAGVSGDRTAAGCGGGHEPPRRASPLATDVLAWQASLAEGPVDESDGDRVALLAALERLKAAASAAQAQVAAAMAEEQVERAGSRPAQVQALRSVAGQVGLARRISPAQASRFVALARVLCQDLPGTFAALRSGEISEWQATLVVREAVVLSSADRRAVDALLAPGLGPLGDRGVAQAARRLVDQVDPDAVARRVRRAEADRRVTVRPAPGPAGCAMARLTATMPVAQAVAAYASLREQAASARAAGDERGIGQLMSDGLFARLTGAARVQQGIGVRGDPPGAGLNLEVGLVMTQRTLLRGGSEPAVLTDPAGRAFGQVPAFLARRLVREADRAWLTRLYAAPASGELVAMDSQRRTFTGRLRRLMVWRDQTCRMPWCEAPVRHVDHVRAHAEGGSTTAANGAGLCESCNYLKQAPGWRAEVIERGERVIEFTTPAGHRYRSQAPRAPGHHPRSLEDGLEQLRDDWDDAIGGVA